MDIAFTLGGAPVTWLELASVAAGLLCVFLAGRASKYNFWVGYLYNILLFLLFAHRHLYSAMLLQPEMLFMSSVARSSVQALGVSCSISMHSSSQIMWDSLPTASTLMFSVSTATPHSFRGPL